MQPDTFGTTRTPELPAALRAVVAAARRRATRAGDGEVDTGHLLHSLLESDPDALAAAAPRPEQTARLMGYLVQRSIGFGRPWRAVAESRCPTRSTGGPAVPPLAARGAVGPRWSAAAAAALERAVRRAADGPGGLPLLAALAADPASRSGQILCSVGIDPAVVRARCESVRRAVRAGT
ncbi:Clp protease N-terminal domain-containing protein [Streptomyces sp. NPDC092296]|uniref:Clp protease N-terminal domain-containing protein n=1 Tax=Streptomyces sp. NPDC092296 TaxID=3366012 RepID=UPI0037F5B794